MALAVHRYRYSGLIGIAVLVLSAALLSNTSPVCAQSGFLDGPPNLGAYSISTTGGITYFMHTVTLPVCFRNEFGAVSRSGSNISFTAWIAGPSPGWSSTASACSSRCLPFENPNGIPALSPAVARHELPWVIVQSKNHQPQRGCDLDHRARATTPLG